MATGAETRRAKTRRVAQAGFTLVELMVALFIVGLAGAAVMLTLPDRGRSLSEETERFAARLKRAQEEAVLTNRPVDVAVTADGYRFRSYSRGAWTPMTEEPFEPQAWGEGVGAHLEAEGGRTGVRFDSLGGAEPAIVTLSREAHAQSVVVDEAGNVRIDPNGG